VCGLFDVLNSYALAIDDYHQALSNLISVMAYNYPAMRYFFKVLSYIF
jgi:hypothetical protein